MRLGIAQILASIAAIITAAGAAAAAAVSSANAGINVPVAVTASAATPLPAHAVRLGVLPQASRLTVDVELKLGNEAGLDALVGGLADPSSPFFRGFVGKGEFGPEFGLSLTAIAQVSGTLRSLGLDPGAVDADRLYIPVTGTASAIDRAFGITLVNYRLADGRVAYANSAAPKVPASIAPYIGGVLGLDNVYLPEPLDHRLAGPSGPASPVAASLVAKSAPAVHGPTACTTAADTAVANGGYTANQLAAHYAMSTLYGMGDLGQGVHVAVAELEPNLPADVAGYESCYGIHTPVNYVTVDAPVAAGAGTGEAALDIENIAGLAPDVTIDDYQDGSTTVDPLYDIAAKVADLDRDEVLSISYGLCEAEAGGLLAAYQTVFKTLNAEGITAVAAAGDSGPTGCYTGTKASPTLSPMTPASTAYVLSIGGTTMTSADPLSTETAWNGTGTDNPGAGGGGVSSELCMPGYQDYNQEFPSDPPILGVISSHSVKAASCDSATDPEGYRREVPDLSANAAGSSPYVIYYNQKWGAFYGTSAATGLVAAEAALVDASPYCSAKGWNSGTRVGLLPQGLYHMLSINNNYVFLGPRPRVVRDVTTGNTDDTASGYTGGLYPATKGYDEATGLGAPLLSGTTTTPTFDPGAASFLCKWYAAKGVSDVSTTSVSPGIAGAGIPVTITVHGTGFMEVPYTVQADLNNSSNTKEIYWAWMTCSSHTTCRVALRGLKAGTYQVEMLVVDILPCSDGCQASATFKIYAAPTITKISPHSGGKGTKVTINGTNFAGVKGVYFGSKKGVGAKVISPSEITVTVPAGSGTVGVKVVAVGGTSKAATYKY